MNIKVALRIRPFNAREKQLKTDLCVKMDEKTTYLLDGNGQVQKRSYTVDHCFWSHDGFYTDDNGYNHPTDENSSYHDQKFVYDVLGKDMLANAVNGFHTCLFAYGQTGAGKSYSIFGYGENKGIVPLMCDELFSGTFLKSNRDQSFSLNISMLEIYNEKAQDLLIPVKMRAKNGLKVRENLKIGVYVDGLSKHRVNSYEEIEHMINEGNKNRTLASTLMNATSSRAHTIITIEVTQKKKTLKTETSKTSIINLVDLAGSEKVSKTGARNDRLKEACSINKSLSVLGIVIHQLFKKSEGKKTIVSYRDSVLTRILQNALGGNSKTTMICAISPARDNMDETLSTLRYAEQAKRIKLKPKVNESATDKLIRELTAENERLKKLLAERDGGVPIKEVKEDEASQIDVSEPEETKEDIINQMETIQEVIEESEEIESPVHKTTSLTMGIHYKKLSPEQIKTCPHLTNLNEDPLLNMMVFYNFKQTPLIRVGRESDDSMIEESKDEIKIVLNGIGIIQEHATLLCTTDKVVMMISDESAACNTFVNGESLDSFPNPNGNGYMRECINFDRIIFGTGTTFLLRMPTEGINLDKPQIDGKDIDWEFCQIEKLKHQEMVSAKNVENFYEEQQTEIKNRETLLHFDFDREKALYVDQMKQQKEQYETNILKLQEQLKEHEREKLEMKKAEEEMAYQEIYQQLEIDLKQKELEHKENLDELQNEAKRLKVMQTVNDNLEKRLITYYPRIIEANATAQTLNRNITFVPFVASLNVFSALNKTNITPDLLINVKVMNYENGWVNYWDLEKFENRLQLMRDSVEYFFSTNEINYTEETDPFWDPKQYSLYAQGICIMKSVLYKLEFNVVVGIIGFDSDLGTLQVNMLPVDEKNVIIDEDDDDNYFDDLEDLIKDKISCHYRIEFGQLKLKEIENIKGKKMLIEFEVLTDNGFETFKTKELVVEQESIYINSAFFISLKEVTEEVIDYYLSDKLQVKLMIEDLDEIEVKGKDLPPIIVNSKKVDMKKKYNVQIPKRITNLPGRMDSDYGLKKKNFKKKAKPEKKKKAKKGEKKRDSNMCSIF